MRLSILFLLLALNVNAQTIINTGGSTTVYKEQGGRQFDSLMSVPKIDTTRGKAYCSGCRTIGRVVVASDSNLYYYNGVLWKKLSNQSTDTSSISTRIDARVKYTDTSASWFVTRNYLTATYLGSTNITTLGTITTGTWNGGVIAGLYGGTGVANSGKTITLGGNISTASSFTTSGANSLTLTTTGSTNVTLPTSGTLMTTSAFSGGVANYVPTFSSSSVITAGDIRDDLSGHVSINTAVNSSYSLLVNGSLAVISGSFTSAGGINLQNDVIHSWGNSTTAFRTWGNSSSSNMTLLSIATGGFSADIIGYNRSGINTPVFQVAEGIGTHVKLMFPNNAHIQAGSNGALRATTNVIEATGDISVLGTSGNTYKWDATSGTPSNTITPVGWIKINVAGTDSWIQYYQ